MTIKEHHIPDPHGVDENQGSHDVGRRWYHRRPEPRRGTDLSAPGSSWWSWLILILVALFPFPWWW